MIKKLINNGPFLAIVTYFFGAIYSVNVKSATSLPLFEIVFFRFFLGFLVLYFISNREKARKIPLKQYLYLHLSRSILGSFCVASYVYSLHFIPLSTWTALSFTNPLMLAIFAFILLKEKIPLIRWIAIFLGFLGVIIIVEPTHTGGYLPIIILLIGSASGALSDICVRKLSLFYTSSTIVLFFFGFSALIIFPILPFVWVTPSVKEGILLGGIGIVGALTQLMLTKAFQLSPASVIAPFAYLSIVWASALGWILWDEKITYRSLLGILFIIADGVFAIISVTPRNSNKKIQKRL